MANPSRQQLSIGASSPVKVITVFVGLLMIFGSGLFALVMVSFGFFAGGTEGRTNIDDEPFHFDENGNLVSGPAPDQLDLTLNAGTVIASLGGLCGLFVALFAAYAVVRVLRTKAWLDGTMLSLRGAFQTKSADLATAAISGGSRLQSVGSSERRSYHRVPVLRADRVTLPLRGAGTGMLPGAELIALADAITGRRTHTGPDDPAYVVAERLREYARDPFA